MNQSKENRADIQAHETRQERIAGNTLFSKAEQSLFVLTRWLNTGGLVLLAAMMFLTAGDVCLRYAFARPIEGSYELIEFMMGALVACSLAYTAVLGGHISLDMLTTRFSQRTQAFLNALSLVLSAVIFAIITWRSLIYGTKLKMDGYVSMSLYIPVYPFVYLMALGSFLLALVFLFQGTREFRKLISREAWRSGGFYACLLAAVVAVIFSPLGPLPWEVEPITSGLMGIVFLVIILFAGIPIGTTMALVGFVGLAYLNGLVPGFNTMGMTPHSTATSYNMSVIPLFVLMGAFCFHSGMIKELYWATHKWIGHLHGGLAMATVAACALIAAVSGSSLATAATMAMVALPEMDRYKYDRGLSTGCIAAGGSIGILIPPSIILVLYGILTQQSIGKLFMAGIIPGILEAVFYILTIYILCRRNPLLGPKAERTPMVDRFKSLKSIWGVGGLFILVIGGIYTGIFTATEAAGVGAFGALVLALLKRMRWKGFQESLSESVKTTAMIFFILIGANILGYFLAVTRLPFELSNFVSELQVNRYFIMAFIIVLYLFLGAIMSSLAMVVLTVPIIFPVVEAMGFDPIWFGIIIVRVVEVGQISPPVGINLFIVKGIAKDISLGVMFRGIWPFIVADVCHIALLLAVPQLATFLPSLMR